jgi:diguanylate cyclase (GGDEF)-like protein
LRRETEKAKQELSGLRTAQLLEVNDRLVQAAVQADTAAQTAVSSLDELTRSTQHDELTGATTRVLMLDRLHSAISRAQRSSARVGLLFLDLDGFKQINDIHGHDAGDALLIEVAGRLRNHLRSSDLIARLGGDEFLVVLEDIHDLGPVEIVSKKLLAEILQPLRLAGADLQVTASIGISVLPDDAVDASALMKHADTAMYAAKQAGKNTLRFYSAGPAANDPRAQDAKSGS